MVVNTELFSYKNNKRIATDQLEYIVFILVEKYREFNGHNFLMPSWWPKNIAFSHPMVQQKTITTNTEWKNILLDVIENYCKFNNDSWWLSELLHKTERKLISEVINKKSDSAKSESKLRVKESALLNLLPQPVVVLHDVIKYGLNENKEEFLRGLNLMKTNKLLVNRARYKLRRLDQYPIASMPPKYKEKLIRNKPLNGFIAKHVVKPCYVKLEVIEMNKNHSTKVGEQSESSVNPRVNLSRLPQTVTKKSPYPYVLLSPLPIKQPKNSMLPYVNLYNLNHKTVKSSKKRNDGKRSNPTAARTKATDSKKNRKKKKDIIKIKWISPKVKMQIFTL